MKKLIFLLILTILCIFGNSTTHASTFITDGLLSYWTFDRNTIDEGIAEDSWGEKDAIIKGNPTLTTGFFGQGLEFDGAGDYVILSDVGNFQSRIGPSTIEFWMKTSDTSTYRTLFRVVDESCVVKNIGWGLTVNGSVEKKPLPVPGGIQNNPIQNDAFQVIFKEGFVLHENARLRKGPKCSGLSIIPFRHSISDGEWHHIVLVTNALFIDETDKVSEINHLYIDNLHFPNPLMELIRAIGSKKKDFIPHSPPVYLGAVNTNGRPHGYYKGVIDEVRVYNRALTHDEVTNNYLTQDFLAVEPTGKLPMVWGELKGRR